MRPNRQSRAPAPTHEFDDERLREVFTLREAPPALDEYLSSIQIDDENPGFLIAWDMNNLVAFVDAANGVDLANAPAPDWLQTRPGAITVNSFTDDLMDELQQAAGGRCGRVLLAPNNFSQFGGIFGMLGAVITDPFMQAAAQAAFGNVDLRIATTYNLTDTRVERAVPNNIRRVRRNHQLWHRIFI